MSEPIEPDARAGDADRKLTAERLKCALDEGRLDLTEYDERLQIAFAAKTYRQLDELVVDIPGVAPLSRSAVAKTTGDGESVDRIRQARIREIKTAWTAFGGAAILFTGIWLIGWMGSGYAGYWPIWVLGVWGIVAVCQTWYTIMRDGSELVDDHSDDDETDDGR
ncbi:uncharacterized protein DUF1707 [Stackebrandtia endophytica]|uniref:Uncharacterized protein DUF1707 n=1 Tax=Stackebrandtia endophytica TaxID=1496996 RepID=A0A543B021_9ACTN|nr:DUF1707 domain-containing protein [Stackebrandtia endophytica]TQL78100.1 uncharacterized protein DUF1707 [Stackebrandtia endophytica]